MRIRRLMLALRTAGGRSSRGDIASTTRFTCSAMSVAASCSSTGFALGRRVHIWKEGYKRQAASGKRPRLCEDALGIASLTNKIIPTV